MLFFDQMKNGNIRVLLDGKCIGKIKAIPGTWNWQFNDEPSVDNKGLIMNRLCNKYKENNNA